VHEAVCLIAEIVGSALRKAGKLERNLAGRKKANAVFSNTLIVSPRSTVA
jgi:hypothetical protein